MKPARAAKRSAREDYAAKMVAPFAVLGIRTADEFVTAIEYLPRDAPRLAPKNRVAERACEELAHYLRDPAFRFDLATAARGTAFQRRVWDAIREIPPGASMSYGDLARKLNTAPRAIGKACGANPIALVVPCHRVVGGRGAIGGFMGTAEGGPLAIKAWLLRHEGCRAGERES